MNITNKEINDLIGIKESFELPEKMMKILFDKNSREKLYNEILKFDIDMSNDFFRDYFQEEHSDRKGLKQDYTPDCICEILSKLQCQSNNLLDVCSGTGSLTINSYKDNMKFQCEELSSRSIPILLFNLSIRGMNGIVCQVDVLQNKIQHIYKLTRNNKFSDIEEIEEIEEKKFDVIISNPPYSLEWVPKYDERFEGYELPPKNKADYAFVLDIVYRLNENGEAFIVLPHGVLFRGQSEQKIRNQLIENNLIDAVIGLPNKLFINTQIPVFILVLKKNRKSKDILFIDSSKNFMSQSKQNDMNEEQISKIINTYKNREEINKYSHVATLEEIRQNDYNLNIPRYVDTFEAVQIPDLKEVVTDIINIDYEIKKTNKDLKELIVQLEGTTHEEKKYYEESIKPFINWLGGEEI